MVFLNIHIGVSSPTILAIYTWHGLYYIFIPLGLDQIFIWMGPTPPMPPSLPVLHAHTCVGTLPHWKPMWQYPIT